MGILLRVLIVEDSEDDALLIARQLRRSDYELIFERVDTAESMKSALARQPWDIVIADYSMPRFSGLAALKLLRDSGLDLPFIIVSGTIGEDVAVAAMKGGAHDYVLKDNLVRLGPAVQRELREAKGRMARRRAEEQLRESEARYRQSVENSPNPIFTVDRQGIVQTWNRACQQIFQYESDEMIGQTYHRLLWDPQDRAEIEVVLAQIWQGHSLSEQDILYRCKDGNQRFMVSRLYPLFDHNKNIQGCVFANTDITERKQAEQAVKERQQYLEGVLAAAPDAIVTLDADGRVVEWNPGAERLFGYSKEEALGQDIDRLVTNPDTFEAGMRFTQILMGGEDVPPMEAVRYRKDGAPVDAILAASPILIEGRLLGGVVVYTDISVRKRAERLLGALNVASLAMQRAMTPEEVFTTVGEEFKKLGFSCAILLTGESQSRLFPKYFSYETKAVRAAEKLLGVKAERFSLPIDAVDVFRQTIWEGHTVLAEGGDDLGKVLPGSLKRFAGQLIRILKVPKSINVPLIVEDEVIGLLSVQSDDLTGDDVPAINAFAHQMSAAWHRANLMQHLETSLEELKQTQAQFLQAQKMEAIGRLAGGVAHDFNNTLTIIHLSTQLLKRQLRPEDPLWEYVQQIEEAGDRAAALTKQLLSFSRREIIEPRVINLNRVVGDLSRMLQRLIGEDIELVTNLADDLWSVYMDPTQIDQMIVNLAVNARDAMPRGGRLTIETTNAVLDETYAAHHVDVEPGEYVRLTISDTGVGMDEEVKARIFEPFFTTKERGRGTGLGLSTVFGIVKQNGGHIWVYSEVGQGTTFKIYLPCVEQVEAKAPLPVVPAGVVGGTETILVVEDDAIVRGLAVRILNTQGYQALAAGNGPAAIQVSNDYDGVIHLLLTDMVMPQMSGRELVERIRARRPQVRALYMSGHSDDVIAHHGALEEGVVFLPKPFTVESLTQKVRAVLDALP